MTVRLSVPLGLAILLGIAAGASAQKDTSTGQAKAKADAPKGKAAAVVPEAEKAKTEKATFGGGCFWCLEAVFERIKGVKGVVSGYAGGTTSRPSYEMVCTGTTGHAEVVQIEYDPEVVTFNELLNVFWECHDPTSLNAQGPDHGTQYRSIILYHDEGQKLAARKSYDKITAAGIFPAPIVTELVPLQKFYPAEKHHQDYFRRNKNDAYCQAQIAPKIVKLKAFLQANAREKSRAK